MKSSIFHANMTYEEAQLAFFRAIRQTSDKTQAQQLKQEYKIFASDILRREKESPAPCLTSYRI